jgi:type IV pilus assembly protein PilB
MVEPDNLDATDELNRILRPQGLGLQRMVLTPEDYQQLLSKYLDQQIEDQKQLDLQKAVDVKSDLEDIENLASEGAADEIDADLDEAMQGTGDAPVINLVNKILVKALQEGF